MAKMIILRKYNIMFENHIQHNMSFENQYLFHLCYFSTIRPSLIDREDLKIAETH